MYFICQLFMRIMRGWKRKLLFLQSGSFMHPLSQNSAEAKLTAGLLGVYILYIHLNINETLLVGC